MSVKNTFLNLFFPPKCTFCSRILEQSGLFLCPDCQRSLPWLTGSAAERKVEFASLCVSPLRFKAPVDASILRFKFSGRSWYAKTYGVLTAQCVQDHLTGKYDLISWVPVSRKRKRKRGYDQAFLLARETAKHLGETLLPTLEKVRHNKAQSSLEDDAARRANVLGAYRVLDPVQIEGKRVLLVDDVVTTGQTLSECARTLRMAGAEDVLCVTLAKAREQS